VVLQAPRKITTLRKASATSIFVEYGVSCKPLSGRTIVVTRPKGQARELAIVLEDSGARVFSAASSQDKQPTSFVGLDRALRNLKRYDAVVFTSQNAVERFFRRAHVLKLKPLKPPARLYAIGPGTAASLHQKGWPSARIPEVHRAEELARAMGAVKGLRILIPRAKLAREELLKNLRQKGAQVEIVEAYRTVPDKSSARRLRQQAATGKIDAVTFTSASAVKSFSALLGRPYCRRLFRTAAAASIGPVTSEALRSCAIEPAIQARRATTKSLVEGLKAHFGVRAQ
jgi:uroporphyrinogen III methyltransferase/synthase